LDRRKTGAAGFAKLRFGFDLQRTIRQLEYHLHKTAILGRAEA
jgi:hypothetical protein